ncbi:GntR family transcriptional regulator [Tropicimonas sp.]|uniref:GntR family transcriptional regulator n=1 Tax=Tropicimonas sp. TaxID=2067044 RepID=UPI003A83F2C3
MTKRLAQLSLDPIVRPSVADQVFEKLHGEIVSLALPPDTRMSEIDVARALGTSRQPVRDAFYRLSKLGFLEIRPQRATRVSLISVDMVMEARFVRTALETEVVRIASERATEEGIAPLRENIDGQAKAVMVDDRALFHHLDDEFHRGISVMSGHPFAWKTISESKAHLDRVRLLSLSFNQANTLEEHRGILAAIESRDGDLAVSRMRRHLSRLIEEIDRIRSENRSYFDGGDED